MPDYNAAEQHALTVSRVAEAYFRSQTLVVGEENPANVSQLQWRACTAVAKAFIADPKMTARQIHQVWRTVFLKEEHPTLLPYAARCGWDDLSPGDQYCELAGLASLREALAPVKEPA